MKTTKLLHCRLIEICAVIWSSTEIASQHTYRGMCGNLVKNGSRHAVIHEGRGAKSRYKIFSRCRRLVASENPVSGASEKRFHSHTRLSEILTS